MRKLASTQKWVAMLVLGTLLLGLCSPGLIKLEAAESAPELFVTEIHPDVDGADDYEFFEVYNNSNQPLYLNDYKFIYHYTLGDYEDQTLTFDHTILGPGQFMVFWYNPKSLSIDAFNTKHGITLNADQVVEVSGFSGLANGGNRAVIIENSEGEEISSSSYVATDVASGLGIHYMLAATGIETDKYAVQSAPTPGSSEADQLPDTPVMLPAINYAPAIDHTPVTEGKAADGLTVSAQLFNAESVTQSVYETVTAAVYHKPASAVEFTYIPLNPTDESLYEATIPGSELTEAEHHYYIQASDGTNVTTTNTYTASIETLDFDYSSVPDVLITELVPDSTNVNGADGYEFIEIYNNTDTTIDLQDYELLYRYTDDPEKEDLDWALGPVTLASKEAMVLWIINGGNTLLEVADFNNFYNTSLIENEEIIKVHSDGMANGGKRKLIVATKAGLEISEAYYDNDDETKANKGIFYSYPIDGTNQMVKYSAGLEAATPGSLAAGQAPTVTSGTPAPINHQPVLTHVPPDEATSAQNLTITTLITNNESSDPADAVSATLYYRSASETSYQEVAMSVGAGDQYSGVIPKSALTEETVVYYIQAQDGINTVQSDTYTVYVKSDDFDYGQVPPMLVTELVPDSSNVGSADGFEFIEIYNNTDQTINFKNYKIQYRYTDSGPDADVVWPTDEEEVLIAAGDTLVFWVINSQNGASTVADFNANYGTSLVENQDIVRIYSDGMANGGKRGIVIATNTKTQIAAAYYDTNEETQPDKGIFYKYPVNGSTDMIKYSAGLEPATPGEVTEEQVPEVPVSQPADNMEPTFENLLDVTEVHQHKDVELLAEALDDISVKTVALFYKIDDQLEYTKRYLAESFDDTFYHYTIYSPELIGREYVDYYYVVSDGTNEITTETYRLTIVGGQDKSALRLNVKDGDIIGGTKVIKGTAELEPASELDLSLDGQKIVTETYNSLESDAYFAFEVTGVNYYFKNGVTISEEILFTFDDTINSYMTLTVPIDADRLRSGSNVISIRAGSKASPFDEREEENKDDFDVRNVRLVLADGTEIYDLDYADREQVIKMGDSSGKHPALDFEFMLPAEKLASLSYAWDTTSVEDGEHEVRVSHDIAGEAVSQILVDNTPPVITPSLVEGETYRGMFTISAEVVDAIAGVSKLEAQLDGESVTLPYDTSSSALGGGEHVLTISAEDQVGNVASHTVHFTVPDEVPGKPQLVAPSHGKTNASTTTTLSVKVEDPTGDPMDVTFFRGYKYDANAAVGTFSAYQNAVDREPPRQMEPAGEQVFTSADYDKIAAEDGVYLTNDAIDEFPYQRFEVVLNETVSADDAVHVSWQGQSLEGRKVTLYAWSPSLNEWTLLDTYIAGTEDFQLTAEVTAGDYKLDGKLQFMVQDQIPPTADDYDYSFVWMSDTQYYSESYPHIYGDIVDWIAEKKDEMKIKYVVHTGDLVDEADKPYQWETASDNMKVLEDENIPYGVLAGNHDVAGKEGAYDYYWQHFGEDRFKSQDTYGGSLDNNRGHFDLVSSNGNDFIFLYMGWGIGNDEIEWMDEVLKQYPDRMAILNFHEYLLVSGNRAPIADKIFEQIVVPHDNVIAVLSGHYHDAELLVDEMDDNGDGETDRYVYQMLADYQGGPEGGQGYIRLMQFDIDNNKLHMKTYSPYLDDYNFYDPEEYPGKDEFSLDLDLQPKTKRVATDYFEVNVYSDQQIGKVTNVPSGQTASYTWSGLREGSTYEWYALAEDMYSGRMLSDIWKFTVGASSSDEDEEEDEDGQVEAPEVSQQPTPLTSDGTADDTGQITFKTALDSNGKAKIQVNPELLAQAASRAKGKIVIQVQADVSASSVNVAVPASELLKTMRESEVAEVTIDTGLASVTATAEELKAIIGSGEGEVEFAVSTVDKGQLSDEVQARIGDRPVYDFTVSVGGQSVSEFRSKKGIAVEVDYELAEGEEPDQIVVYYIADNGELEPLKVSGYDKATGTIVFYPKHFSKYTAAYAAVTFADLGSAVWAQESIRALAAKEIIHGYDEFSFEPNRRITREEYLKLLLETYELVTPELEKSSTTLSDVSNDDWYYPYVAAAEQLGIVHGKPDGTFGNHESITREDIAVMTYRAAKLADAELETQGRSIFGDAGDIADYAVEAVTALEATSIIQGFENGLFLPQDYATRAEAAMIIHRLLNLELGET